MAFNYQKLVDIHNQSGEKSIDFARAIFGGDSKLGPEYFKGKESISTRHLELLCAHFNVPMNFFFDDTPVPVYNKIGNMVTANQVGVGNVNINSNVEYLKKTIAQLEKTIADKDEQIRWLKEQWEFLTKHLHKGETEK